MKHDAIVGRKIAGRFTIKKLLGEGGMATVYVAERDVEPREVAIKIMNPELMADRAFIRRFQREAKAASAVKHANSVKIYEYGVEGNLSYIVMELLVGQDLYELLERHGALPQARAARILAEVCDVLQAAHEMGIIHRDLKPENIMVLPDPKAPHGERVKVLDFGIAKLLEAEMTPENGPVDSADGPPSAITRVGQIVGTPAYMSPEQCGLLPVDTRSDIYTCGVLLFQLVTGKLPFEGQTPFHTASMHIHAPVPSPSAIVPGLEPRFEALIMKALAKKPSERHQTARHLGASLRKLVPDLPNASVVTGPISLRQTSSKLPREAPPPLDITPPAAAAAPPLAPAPNAPPMQLSFDDDAISIESARTLVSVAGELGPPPHVLLHSAAAQRAAEAPPRLTPHDSGDDLPTLERERKPDKAPAAAWPAGPTPLPGVDDDLDPEDRAVTLVRPPSESHPDLGVALPSAAGGRDVKTTLRSAEEFGPRSPERRPEVQVQHPLGVAGTAKMLPSVEVPDPAPREAASRVQISPAALAPSDPLARSDAFPVDGIPKRVLQTVRIHQPPGTGPSPLPQHENAPPQMTPASVTPLAPGAGTIPMPPRPTPIGQLPPTMSDLRLTEASAGGLLSGRFGLVIGFMAGMLITAVVVAVYLFVLR